jgi:hypothetical protein
MAPAKHAASFSISSNEMSGSSSKRQKIGSGKHPDRRESSVLGTFQHLLALL